MKQQKASQTPNRLSAKLNDPMYTYLQAIGRYRLLTPEEEIKLGRKVRKLMTLIEARDFLSEQLQRPPTLIEWADTVHYSPAMLEAAIAVGEQSKQKMIQANLRLVVMIAKQYQERGLDLLDLVQEGNLGLIQAVEKFDSTKGCKFCTHAFWWIRQAITRAIAQKSRSIRLPIYAVERLNKLKKVQRELEQKLGRTATIRECATHPDLEEDEQQIRFLLKVSCQTFSLDKLVGESQGEGQQTPLVELLEDKRQNPVNSAVERERDQKLAGLLRELPPRQQEVLVQRFGIDSGSPKTLTEIGQEKGLTRERVRQIQNKAIRQIRRKAKFLVEM